MHEKKNKIERFAGGAGIATMGVMLFVLVWMFAGVAALITSIICITKTSAAPNDNLVGLLLALFFGPFYWIYFIAKTGYCTEIK